MNKKFSVITLVIVLVNLFTPNYPISKAQYSQTALSDSPFRLLGHIGGFASAIGIYSHYAYIGLGPELAIFDINQPNLPIQLGSVLLPGVLKNMVIQYPYVFIAAERGGLQIVNISNPQKPSITGNAQITNSAIGIAVKGRYAYVCDSGNMYIVDILNANLPVQVGTIPVDALDLVVYGEYLIAGKSIYSISNPIAPVKISQLDLFWVNQITERWPIVYMTTYNGTEIVNLTNPYNPIIIGRISGSGDVAIVGDLALAISTTCDSYCTGYLTIEGSGISNTQEYNRLEYPGHPTRIAYYAGYAFIPDGLYGGFKVFRVTDPLLPPVEIYHYKSPGNIKDIEIEGDYLFALDEWLGLRSINIKYPSAPLLKNTLFLSGEKQQISAYGGHAFVTADYGGLHSINISNPNAMYREGGLTQYLSSPLGVAAVNGYTYFSESDYFRVVDVRNPTNPVIVGSCSTPYYNATGIAVRNNYAFLAMGAGIRVVNVAHPLSPTVVAIIDTGQIYTAWDIGLGPDHAYIPRNPGYVDIIDISNPLHPNQVNEFYPSSDSYGITIADNFGYIATEAGLILADMSDPEMPVELGMYPTASKSLRVILKNDVIYVASGEGGIYIFELNYFDIKGSIIGPNEKPVVNIPVSLESGTSSVSNTDGAYEFLKLVPNEYTITPYLIDYRFIPEKRTVRVPPNAIRLNFTILPKPVEVILTPGISETITVTDLQGLKTKFVIPSNTVTEALTLRIIPDISSNRIGYAFTGHAYELQIYRGSELLPDFVFNEPITLQVVYSDFDVRLVSDEDTLNVWKQISSNWLPGSLICIPPNEILLDTESNYVEQAICQSGKYALYGTAENLFLPYIIR